MSSEADGAKWLPPVLVAAAGGLGGLTAWVWSITMGAPLVPGTTGPVGANVFLGAVAGFVAIYAIKVDPSRALIHSLALAMVCGLAWKTTLEAGRDLVITRLEDGEVAEQAQEARQSIEKLEDANAETAPILIEELEAVTEDLMRSGDSVRNRALRKEVDRVVADSVEALREAAEKAPEAGARALGSLGAAAARENRPAISEAAAGSLIRLAEYTGFEVGASSEVSNALLRLSAAARADQREGAAGALREQSVEVFRQAEDRARRDEPDRVIELRERSFVAHELPLRER